MNNLITNNEVLTPALRSVLQLMLQTEPNKLEV